MKIAFLLLFIHFVADFIMQSDWMAQNKSKKFYPLFIHVAIYSYIFFIGSIIIGSLFLQDSYLQTLPVKSLIFAGITFICHFLTDFVTSRINSYLWSKKEVHWFFVSIGFDQLLHYAQLFLTWNLLFG